MLSRRLIPPEKSPNISLLRSLSPEHFARTFRHPEHPGILTIDWILADYSWHGRHHVAHITSLREREGWR